MALGAGKDRTNVKIAAGLAFRADKRIADVIFSGEVDQIKLSQFAQLLSKVSGKKISTEKLPRIELRDVKLYVVPKDTTIADKIYEQGLQAQGNMVIDKFKGGMKLLVDTEDKVITADGHLDKMDYGVFVITGRGPDGKLGTNDDQAEISLQISPKSIKDSRFKISGIVQVPPLKFKRESIVELSKDGGTFTLSGELAYLKVNLEGDIDFDDPAKTIISFEVTRDARKNLMSKLSRTLQKRNEKSTERLADIQKKLKSTRSKFGESRLKKAKELQESIDRFQEKCNTVSGVKKAITKSCIQLQAQKQRLNVMEFGGMIASKALGAVQGLTKGLQGARAGISKIQSKVEALRGKYQIVSIGGKISAQQIKEAKTPMATVKLAGGKEFQVQVNVADLGKEVRRIIKERFLKLAPAN
jgi:hypothetical protein